MRTKNVRPQAVFAASLTALLLLATGASPAFSAPVDQAGEEDITIGVVAKASFDDETISLSGPLSSFSLHAPSNTIVNHQFETVDEGTSVLINTQLTEESGGVTTFNLTSDERAISEILVDDDGVESFMLLSEENDFLGGVASTVATDANGNQLGVSYSIDGSALRLSLESESGPIAFPANITTAVSTVWYSSGWVSTNPYYIVNVNPTTLGRQQIALNVHYLHVIHAKTVLGNYATNTYWNWGIEHQFLCHVVGAWFPSGVYNMENWQPWLHWNQIANPWDRCNRIK